jgi:hypothetical protein
MLERSDPQTMMGAHAAHCLIQNRKRFQAKASFKDGVLEVRSRRRPPEEVLRRGCEQRPVASRLIGLAPRCVEVEETRDRHLNVTPWR